jgi:hypothetical protein
MRYVTIALADDGDTVRIDDVEEVRVEHGALVVEERSNVHRLGRVTFLAHGQWREATVMER